MTLEVRRIFLSFAIIFSLLTSTSCEKSYNECNQLGCYMKPVNIFCNSSQKSITNVTCYIKPLSRYSGVFGFSCNIFKPLSNFYATITLFHRPITSIKFHKIYSLKDLEVCKWLNISKSSKLGFMRPLIKLLNTTLKGIIQNCPYQGKYEVHNTSLPNIGTQDVIDSISPTIWPNGIYRNYIRLHDKKDDNIMSVVLTEEYYNREVHLLNKDNF